MGSTTLSSSGESSLGSLLSVSTAESVASTVADEAEEKGEALDCGRKTLEVSDDVVLAWEERSDLGAGKFRVRVFEVGSKRREGEEAEAAAIAVL